MLIYIKEKCAFRFHPANRSTMPCHHRQHGILHNVRSQSVQHVLPERSNSRFQYAMTQMKDDTASLSPRPAETAPGRIPRRSPAAAHLNESRCGHLPMGRLFAFHGRHHVADTTPAAKAE